jgi:hypothetical protein
MIFTIFDFIAGGILYNHLSTWEEGDLAVASGEHFCQDCIMKDNTADCFGPIRATTPLFLVADNAVSTVHLESGSTLPSLVFHLTDAYHSKTVGCEIPFDVAVQSSDAENLVVFGKTLGRSVNGTKGWNHVFCFCARTGCILCFLLLPC